MMAVCSLPSRVPFREHSPSDGKKEGGFALGDRGAAGYPETSPGRADKIAAGEPAAMLAYGKITRRHCPRAPPKRRRRYLQVEAVRSRERALFQRRRRTSRVEVETWRQ